MAKNKVVDVQASIEFEGLEKLLRNLERLKGNKKNIKALNELIGTIAASKEVLSQFKGDSMADDASTYVFKLGKVAEQFNRIKFGDILSGMKNGDDAVKEIKKIYTKVNNYKDKIDRLVFSAERNIRKKTSAITSPIVTGSSATKETAGELRNRKYLQRVENNTAIREGKRIDKNSAYRQKIENNTALRNSRRMDKASAERARIDKAEVRAYATSGTDTLSRTKRATSFQTSGDTDKEITRRKKNVVLLKQEEALKKKLFNISPTEESARALEVATKNRLKGEKLVTEIIARRNLLLDSEKTKIKAAKDEAKKQVDLAKERADIEAARIKTEREGIIATAKKDIYSGVTKKDISKITSIGGADSEIENRKQILALRKLEEAELLKQVNASANLKETERLITKYKEARLATKNASADIKAVEVRKQELAVEVKISNKIKEITERIQHLSTKDGKISFEEAKRSVESINSEIRKLPANIRKAKTKGFSEDLNKAGISVKRVNSGLKLVSHSMNRVEGKITGVIKKMFSWEKIVQRASFVMTATLSYKLFDYFVRGLKTAIATNLKLNDELAKTFALLTGISKSQKDILTSGTAELARKYRLELNDVSDALYQIISAQVGVAEASQVLEASLKLAVGGFASAKDSALALVQILNAFDLSASQATHVADVMFQTTKLGIITTQQYSTEISKVAATASLFGLSIEEVSAVISTMTRNGVKVSHAFTSLNQLLMTIAKPTEKAKKLMNLYGVSMSMNDVRAKGLIGTLQELGGVLGSEEAITTIFKNRTGFRAMASLVQNQQDYIADLIKMYDSVGEAETASTARLNTTSALLRKIKVDATEAGRVIGAGLEPAIRTLAKGFSNFLVGVVNALPYIINGVKTLAAQIFLMKLPLMLSLTRKGLVGIKNIVSLLVVQMRTALKPSLRAVGQTATMAWAEATLGLSILIGLILQAVSALATYQKKVRHQKLIKSLGLEDATAELGQLNRQIENMNSNLSKIDGMAKLLEQSNQLKISMRGNNKLQDEFAETISKIVGKNVTYNGILKNSKTLIEEMSTAYEDQAKLMFKMQVRQQKLTVQTGIRSSIDRLGSNKLLNPKLSAYGRARDFYDKNKTDDNTNQEVINAYTQSSIRGGGFGRTANRINMTDLLNLASGEINDNTNVLQGTKIELAQKNISDLSKSLVETLRTVDSLTDKETLDKLRIDAEKLEDDAIGFKDELTKDQGKVETFRNEQASIASNILLYLDYIDAANINFKRPKPVKTEAKKLAEKLSDFQEAYLDLLRKMGLTAESSFADALADLQKKIKEEGLGKDSDLIALETIGKASVGFADFDDAIKTKVNSIDAIYDKVGKATGALATSKRQAVPMTGASDSLKSSENLDLAKAGEDIDALAFAKIKNNEIILSNLFEKEVLAYFGSLTSDLERVKFVTDLGVVESEYKKFIKSLASKSMDDLENMLLEEGTTKLKSSIIKTVMADRQAKFVDAIVGFGKDYGIDEKGVRSSMKDMTSLYGYLETQLDIYGVTMRDFNALLIAQIEGDDKEVIRLNAKIVDRGGVAVPDLSSKLPEDFEKWAPKAQRDYKSSIIGKPEDRTSLSEISGGDAKDMLMNSITGGKELTAGDALNQVEGKAMEVGMAAWQTYLDGKVTALENEKERLLKVEEDALAAQQEMSNRMLANDNLSSQQREALTKRMEAKKLASAKKQQDIQDKFDKKIAEKKKENAIKEVWLEHFKAIAIIWAKALSINFPEGVPMAAALTAILTGLTAIQANQIDKQQFSEGGYTGRGDKHEPAGTVHKGEIVIDKKTTDKNYGALMSMYGALKGGMDFRDFATSFLINGRMKKSPITNNTNSFASGGYVGHRNSSNSETMHIAIDLQGAKVIDAVDLHKMVEVGGKRRRTING